MTASPIASVRVFETVQRRRCRRATFGALPALSVRDRAIIVLNDYRFWEFILPLGGALVFLLSGLIFTVPTIPTLRPKLRKVPRRSFSMAIAFDCSSLR